MNKKYYIYGKHSTFSALLNPKRKIHQILISNSYDIDSLKTFFNKHSLTKKFISMIKIVTIKELESILETKLNHQGIAVLTEELVQPQLNTLIKNINNHEFNTLCILDRVTDPNNIGAILRSCAAFNIRAIITPKYHSAKENSAIAKTSSGALEIVPLIQVSNLVNTLNFLKKNNFWIIGLDSNSSSNNIELLKEYPNIAIIIGNENKGLRKLTQDNCDLILKIPFKKTNIESLNLSNAAAIAFYLRFWTSL